ncbi:MAG: hypothetical protein RRY36_05190 [Bacteroidaceae bacterium]
MRERIKEFTATLEEQGLEGVIKTEDEINNPVITVNGKRYYTWEQLSIRLRLTRKYIYEKVKTGRISMLSIKGLRLYRVNY